MGGSATGWLGLSIAVRSVGWACTTYTLMQVLGGKLSGDPLLSLVGGGLVYGAGLFAFHLYGCGPDARSS